MRGIVSLTVLLSAFGAVAFGEDSVEYFKEGDKLANARGEIEGETPTEVVIKTTKGTVRIPINRVESVKYENQPAQLTTIRSAERRGRAAEAYKRYKEVFDSLSGDDTRLHTAVAFDMFRAAAKAAVADPRKAERPIKMYAQSKDRFRQTRHYYPMRELIGQVYLAAGDVEKAAEAFGALTEVDWPGYREKGTVYQGLAALRQGNHSVAEQLFKTVIDSPSTDRESTQQKHAAQVYLGQVYVDTGKAKEAVETLRGALERIPADALYVKALGHNALGDALVASSKPKDAMLDGYLWVLTIYDKNPAELARAMYHLSELFPQVGSAERGLEMADRLRTEFPDSEWTKKLGGG